MTALAWLALATASAQAPAACESPMSRIQLGAAVGEVTDALSISELVEARETLDRIHARLPCLDEVVDRKLYALFARYNAIVYYYGQEEGLARKWAAAARLADPDLGWDESVYPEGNAVRALVDEAPLPAEQRLPGKELAPPRGGGVFVDGAFAAVPAAPGDTEVLVQVFDRNGQRLDGFWQQGNAFPHTLALPGDGEARPPAWFTPGAPTPIVSGGGGGGGGGGPAPVRGEFPGGAGRGRRAGGDRRRLLRLRLLAEDAARPRGARRRQGHPHPRQRDGRRQRRLARGRARRRGEGRDDVGGRLHRPLLTPRLREDAQARCVSSHSGGSGSPRSASPGLARTVHFHRATEPEDAMVSQPEPIAPQLPTAEGTGAFNPNYSQTVENLAVGIGIPGAIVGAIATVFLAMAAMRGYPTVGTLGIAALWTVYLATMGALWAVVAEEGPAR
ncbi:MAG: hypothetical protein R3F59_24940 [Myxococcota bacterium]